MFWIKFSLFGHKYNDNKTVSRKICDIRWRLVYSVRRIFYGSTLIIWTCFRFYCDSKAIDDIVYVMTLKTITIVNHNLVCAIKSFMLIPWGISTAYKYIVKDIRVEERTSYNQLKSDHIHFHRVSFRFIAIKQKTL